MREITVLHLLWKSVSQGIEYFLLRPHAAWTADGRPLLAPLTKKVPAADADAALQITLDALRREDLDVAPPLAHLRLRPATALRMSSPTYAVETYYRILPATARCPAKQRKALAKKLGGVWLTRTEALRESSLSPTARLAIDSVRATPAGPLPPHALAGDWTQRLLYARDHDSRAFGPLFEDMKPFLRGLLCRIINRPTDRDDVLAETALLALAHLDTYEPIATPATWLGTILRNTAFSLLRRRSTRRARSLSIPSGTQELADETPSPPEAIEEVEEQARRYALLQQQKVAMTPVQRLAWRLRHEERMEYHEISETLDVPVGTLGTWFARVKRNLEAEGPQR